jgi:hypothetical protein
MPLETHVMYTVAEGVAYLIGHAEIPSQFHVRASVPKDNCSSEDLY